MWLTDFNKSEKKQKVNALRHTGIFTVAEPNRWSAQLVTIKTVLLKVHTFTSKQQGIPQKATNNNAAM